MNNIFNAYLMVDWSANQSPKKGPDSIWYCLHQCDGDIVSNPRTRHQAFSEISSLLKSLVKQNKRILVGFDFPYSYPAGLSKYLPSNEARKDSWKVIWDTLANHIQDLENNSNNRFAVATELNKLISGSSSPFWGCPSKAVSKYLSMTKPALPKTLKAFRMVEGRHPGPKSVWQLFYNGSVGSQALVGIPYIYKLRYDSLLKDKSLVWPFETGFFLPTKYSPWMILHAEIYPSIIKVSNRATKVKDQEQVENLAHYFAELDSKGELGEYFAAPKDLSQENCHMVESEEGWILGIK